VYNSIVMSPALVFISMLVPAMACPNGGGI
jgi:hypothetical protein